MENRFLRKALLLLVAASMLLISSTAFAVTHVVPGKFSSIQEAIDNAVDGDVISVRPGIYYENLTIGAKSITVKSMNGPAQTILDGSRKDPVVSFVTLDAPAASWTPTIEGFTIQNGVPSTTDSNKNHGGGIAFYNGISSSQLTITINNCSITNNSGNIGSAIGGWGPPSWSATVHMYLNNSTVSNNSGGYGAIFSQCTTYFINNTNFVNNTGTIGGAIYSGYLGVMSINRCYFSGNTAADRGGAIVTDSIWSFVNVFSSVFDLNTAANSGGAIALGAQEYNHFNMRGCTVTRNTAPAGGSIAQTSGLVNLIGVNNIIYGNSTPPVFADLSRVSLQYSDVEGGLVGTGNIDTDPLFVNALARNYQLAPGSPAIDSGIIDNWNNYTADMYGFVRPSGSTNDMGAYEVVVPDTAAPVSTATVSGDVNANGIYTSDVTISIAAQDNIGVKEVHYIVNGTETVSASGTVSMTLSETGTYAISYFAIDTAGNIETAHSTSITIDKTPPDTTAPVSSAAITGVSGSNGFYTSSVTINITTQDNTGVKEVHYIVNGTETVVAGGTATISLTSNGSYAISYFSVDTAGNAEAAKAISVNIDKTAPTVSSTYPANNSTGVSTSASIIITFSENILQGSAYSNITLKKGTTTVSSTKTISGNKLTIKPSSSMSSTTSYTVSIPANAVKDSAGNNNAQYSLSFKTR